uniref:Selenoprotein P N-terminal domain-containing protein n=2 Tax=Monodelphis domestica TaxID=13616 RepID=A0A5F8HBX3_MONDO
MKLEREGFSNISYVVVNHQGNASRLNIKELQDQVSKNITVYQQEQNQKDVWTTLNGNKDDFLIYDRCGRLVYHLGLPHTFLSFSYVEDAIKSAYCEKACGNCSYTTLDDEGFCKNVSLVAEEETITTSLHHHYHPPHRHGHHPHHHHGHHHPPPHRHHQHHHRLGHPPSENDKPEGSEGAVHSHPTQGLHHHHEAAGPQHRHTDHPESQENPEISVSELSVPRKKL